MKKFFCFLLLLLIISIGIGRNIVPQNDISVQASSIDLNDLMLSKFTEWDAYITGGLSTNGTVSDKYEYFQAPLYAQKSLTTYNVLAPLTSFYVATNDVYYRSKLQFLVDEVISNTWYRYSADIGTIHYAPGAWINNAETDSSALVTMEVGIAAVKLYEWLGQACYKNLADAIASESLEMVTINNSTDMTWHYGYYKTPRTEANAKTGVNRNGAIAHFYAVYSSLNTTYGAYVPKIVNWMWRAQLPSGGLTYTIGSGSENHAYTAFSLYHALSAYKYVSAEFSSTLITKMRNSLSYLQKVQGGFMNYLYNYILASVYALAVKTNFITPTANFLETTKTTLYACLQLLNLREKGNAPSLDDYPFGHRWSQYFTGAFFSLYPLPLNLATYASASICAYESGTTGLHKYTGAALACVLSSIRNGYASSQSGLIAGDYYLFTSIKSGAYTRSFTNTSTCVKTWANISSPSLKVLQYIYPSCVVFGNVSGTSTIQVYLLFVANGILRVNNATVFNLATMANGTKVFGSEFMIVQNATMPNRPSVFVYAPSQSSWTFTRYASSMTIEALNIANYNTTMMYLLNWKTFGDNITAVYNALKNITISHHSITPITFDNQVTLYKSQINTVQSENSWMELYKTAVSTQVKLIAHNYPEKVSMSAWAYTPNKLTFTISAPSGTTSTTKIYVDNEGSPRDIWIENGTLSWNYNTSTTTLTLNATHLNPTVKIVVDWRIPGDVNGDSSVDVKDLERIGEAYGSTPLKPRWDEEADLNRDSVINILELFTVGRNYGKREP